MKIFLDGLMKSTENEGEIKIPAFPFQKILRLKILIMKGPVSQEKDETGKIT